MLRLAKIEFAVRCGVVTKAVTTGQWQWRPHARIMGKLNRDKHTAVVARTTQTIKLIWRAGHFMHCNEMITSLHF